LLTLSQRLQKKEVTLMNRKMLIGLVVGMGVLLIGGVAFAHYTGWGGYGGHMMGPGYGPYGGHMMGPGYGSYGGYMMGPGYGGYCWGETPRSYGESKPVTKQETESILKEYIGGNPNLKVGEVRDKGTYFEGEIVTKDNSLVAKYGIDKNTGWVRSLN
jgi:hypothetical protein